MNLVQPFRIRATAVGEDTTLRHVAAWWSKRPKVRATGTPRWPIARHVSMPRLVHFLAALGAFLAGWRRRGACATR